MNGLLRHGHSTLRRLIMRPGYLLTAVAILGLGIAACVVTFTFVRSVLLAPLPYPDSDQIVTIWQDRSAAGGHSEERLSIPAFAILRDELRELRIAVAELPEERI